MEQGSDDRRMERRSFTRHPCNGSCEIFAKGERCGWGSVTDISRGGCYIEIPHPLPIGSEVQLRLNFGGLDFDVAAKVATSYPLVGMGMVFLPIPEAEQNKLTAILARVAGTTASPITPQLDTPLKTTQAMRITPEQAPRILAEIVKHINTKGVLTRQELSDIVLANR